MTVLFAARFGSPADPVVLFAGPRARALVVDDALLFGTLDALGCPLREVRAMSPTEQSSVVATPQEPTETLTSFLRMAEQLGIDLVDGPPTGERHHAFMRRPAQVRHDENISLLGLGFFELRFPRGRAPTPAELARSLCLVGRYDRATAVLREAVRSRPDDAALLFHLGGLLRGAGQLDEAIALFRRSAELAPEQLDPRSSLAVAYTSAGRHREAKQVFEELVVLGGGDFGDYMNLATACLTTGDVDEARRAVHSALAREPESAHAHAVAALVAARSGDRAAADQHRARAERTLPGGDSPMPDIIRGLLRQARSIG